jgi:protocatechuate 3,4-dioxygenase beta subunit
MLLEASLEEDPMSEIWESAVSRRNFLKRAGATVLALGLGGGLGTMVQACGSGGVATTTAAPATSTTTRGPGATATPGSNTTTGSTPSLTVGATEGPYFISGTAELPDGNLNAAGLPGDPIKISGHVYGGSSTSTPLPGAKIEVWHADTNGSYHPNSNGGTADFSPDELALRGYVVTDGSGYYELTSIYPGEYQGRCRHIHVHVTQSEYQGGVSIITQMIAPAKSGDSLTPETDGIARSLPAANDLVFTDNGGVQEATFDFYLGSD